jgi:hypothetical protein
VSAGAPDGAEAPWVADAARLFRSLRDAAASGEAGPGPLADLLDSAGHAPECRACPMCQAVAMIRRNGPELLDGISALAAGLAASLRAARDQEPEHPADLRETAPPPPVVLRTERIDVTD